MVTIGTMTPQELQQMIDQRIDERLTAMLGSFESDSDDADETRSWDEVRASVERHRWTPPSGAKTALELLREDRDR